MKIIPGMSSECDVAASLERPAALIICRAVSLLIDTELTRGERGAVCVHLFGSIPSQLERGQHCSSIVTESLAEPIGCVPMSPDCRPVARGNSGR